MNTEFVTVDGDILWQAFNECKLMKCEYAIVPRNLFQKSVSSSLIGMIHNTVVTTGSFESLLDPKFFDLWPTEGLKWIMFCPKDLMIFKKMRTAIYGTDTIPLKVNIVYNNYSLNGKPVCVGQYIEEVVDKTKTMPGVRVTQALIPKLPLYPYFETMEKINAMFFQRNNASQTVWHQDITKDEDFNDIINSKAAVGELPWYPRVEGLPKEHPYLIYLTSNMLNVSKGDTVEFNLFNRVPGRTANFFVSQFDIFKPKKKCILNYLMLNIVVL